MSNSLEDIYNGLKNNPVTLKTQPTELDKAIKKIEDWMNSKGVSSIHYELNQLILAAKRLKETGTREYPKNGEEYMIELDDIVISNPRRTRQKGKFVITCIKCGVPAAFQNIHKEPWTCIECQSHAAPNTPPTELGKAIARLNSVSIENTSDLSFHYGDIQELILAANRLEDVEKVNKAYSEVIGTNAETIFSLQQRLEEVEKERDHEHSELIRWMVKTSEWCEQHKEELTALRAELKQCAKALDAKISHLPLREYLRVEYPATQGNLPLRDFCINQDKALALPYVQNALKEKQ